jgi:hypothetical protein
MLGRTGAVVTAYGLPGDVKAFVAVVVTLLIYEYTYCSASVIILAALPTDQSWMPEVRARGACQL